MKSLFQGEGCCDYSVLVKNQFINEALGDLLKQPGAATINETMGNINLSFNNWKIAYLKIIFSIKKEFKPDDKIRKDYGISKNLQILKLKWRNASLITLFCNSLKKILDFARFKMNIHF